MKKLELKKDFAELNELFDELSAIKIKLQKKLNEVKEKVKPTNEELGNSIEKYTSHIIWGLKKSLEGTNSLAVSINGRNTKIEI